MRSLITFIGAPGSGKGSRCEECRKKGYIHISSSKLIEEAGYDLSRGRSGISDKEILRLVLNKVNTLGKNAKIVLEGFPRNLEQAELLSKHVEINQVIFLNITKEVALERIKNRYTCPICKIPYSQSYKPPVVEGICNECGTRLIRRTSDTEKVFFKRFKTFNRNAYQIIEYYNNKGVCIKTINAESEFDIIGIIENKDGFD